MIREFTHLVREFLRKRLVQKSYPALVIGMLFVVTYLSFMRFTALNKIPWADLTPVTSAAYYAGHAADVMTVLILFTGWAAALGTIIRSSRDWWTAASWLAAVALMVMILRALLLPSP
jgi:hypothetical protein